MSKKKFTKGLESVFDDAETMQEESVALVDTPTASGAQKVQRIRAKGSSKDFTSDLDMLLEEALSDFQEDPKTKPDEAESKPSAAAKRPLAQRKPVSGLDALIRKTITVKAVEEDASSPTKRVTFTVNKQKLDKLKQIARVEKAYLKDLITEMITEYINTYESGEE